MRLLSTSLILIVICCAPSRAKAGSVFDRVKKRGVVLCGSVQRPGLATINSNGRWSGLNVDVCRAVAAAVLGSPERIEYHGYETPKDFDAVHNHQDDVYFLTGSEIVEQNLTGKVVPGPAVFLESHAVMIASSSAAQHVVDLAGDSICFMIGSPSERSLSAYFDALRKSWFRRAFSEESEMIDAYNVQNCHAIAGEITTLATMHLDPGVNRLSSRILPEPLTAFPVMAVTGTDDAQWSAIVAWTVHALISAERPQTQWYAGATGAMPIAAVELGLNKEWQRSVVAGVGNYGDIYERNLGKGSPLRLERDLNASPMRGGALLSPFIE